MEITVLLQVVLFCLCTIFQVLHSCCNTKYKTFTLNFYYYPLMTEGLNTSQPRVKLSSYEPPV